VPGPVEANLLARPGGHATAGIVVVPRGAVVVSAVLVGGASDDVLVGGVVVDGPVVVDVESFAVVVEPTTVDLGLWGVAACRAVPPQADAAMLKAHAPITRAG
jgi:hypothetical protein